MYKGIIHFIGEQNLEDKNMLIKFKVKNVLSFKDLTEFSMVAGTTFKNDERLVDNGNFKLLKFSSVYGANASGKSNLVKAFQIMKDLVVESFPNYPLDCHFKLQDETNDLNSYFEIILLLNKKSYSYGFEADLINNKFISEWLYELKESKDKMIYERDVVSKTIEFSKSFKNELRNKLNFYVEDIKENDSILLLNFLNKDKPSLYEFQSAKIFKEVYKWFTKSLDIADPDTMLTSGEYFEVENRLNDLSKFMNRFGTGIYTIEKSQKDRDDIKNELPNFIIKEIQEHAMKKMKGNENVKGVGNLLRFNKKFWIINVNRDGTMIFEKISFFHDQEKKYAFSLDDESDGTARILDLAEILLSDEKNKTYIVDELDRCLHPQLTCKFIKEFLEKAKQEGNNNQLIVTTHESRLLDFNILRRDEIWFVEKKDNSSNLYSLEEFNVRFDKKIDKAYLEGRYGGVPIFDEVFPNVITGNENKD